MKCQIGGGRCHYHKEGGVSRWFYSFSYFRCDSVLILRSVVWDSEINMEYSHLLDLKLICFLIFICKFPAKIIHILHIR